MPAKALYAGSSKRSGAAVFGLALVLTASAALADQAEDQFNFATGLFIESDYELAAAEYKAFLDKYPGHALAGQAQFQLGESLMRLEKFKEAIPLFEAYVKRNDTEPDKLAAAYFRLGKARAGLEEHDKAAEIYRAFAQKFPHHKLAPAARYWVGECLLRAGKLAESRQAFELALKLKRGDTYEPYCLYGLACALQALKKHDLAAPHFETVVRRFGKEEFAPDAALRLAQCYDASGRFDDARKAYDAVRQKFGDKLLVESLMGRAWASYHKGELEQAAATFAQIAREHPKHPMAGTAAYNAATALFNVGKHRQALQQFAAIADKKGEYSQPALYWKGMCLLKLGKGREAIEPFEAVAGHKGQYQASAQFGLGEAFYQLGEFDKAVAAYEAAATRFPKDDLADDALHAAAAAASRSGAHDQAVALARRLVREHPASPLKDKTRFIEGESRFRQEKFAEAAQVFAAMLKGNPQGVEKDLILYKLAWCRAKQGKQQSASQLFQRLAKDYPESNLAGESLYMAGKLLTDEGRNKEARALYQQCINKFPNEPAAENAAYALALADFSAGHWQQADGAFEAFIRTYPKSKLLPDAWFYLAEARFASGNFDAAGAAYRTVAQQYPNSRLAPQALYGEAWCLREKSKLHEAAAAFQQTADRFPKDTIAAEALYWAGRTRMDLGEWQAAKTLLTRAQAAPGADKVKADVSYSTAHCLLREKKYDGAINLYNAFLKEFPDSPHRQNVLYDLAWAYLGKQDDKRAFAYFEQVAREANDVRLKADALFRLAEAQYAQEQYDKAASLYSQITKLEGVNFLDKAYYKLGWSHEKLGKKQPALEAYRKAVEQNPAGDLAPEAALRAAVMLQRMGKYDEAAKGFGELAARAGLDKALAARALFHQAESLRSLKKWGEALAIYRKIGQTAPDFEPAYHVYYGFGACALELNALEDARRAFGKVIEQTETETAAKAQLALGEILMRQKKFAEAAREFLKVHFLYAYPRWKARGLLRAGQAFRQAGENERAEKYLKQVVEKFPDSQAAAQAKKLLGK